MDSVEGNPPRDLLAGSDIPVRDMAVTEHPWPKAIRCDKWRFEHYQTTMSDDKNFGELYDLVTDPDKTRNLYRDKACAGVAYEALCRLLEWLIGTARIATMSPVSNRGRYLGITYATADDGEEANTAGLAQQARSGTKHYL